MIQPSAIKSTLRVEANELLSYFSERPTIIISASELNELLYRDVMEAVGDPDTCDTIDIEVDQ